MNQGRKIKCKIILLGDASVGKSSIIGRYVEGEFKQTEASLGASFSSKNMTLDNGTTYNLNIWDTAGSEKFRSMNKFYYRDASIAILVYDLVRNETFESLKSYWVDEVKKNSEEDISKLVLIYFY
ncbi:MAG: GTP-binding protein [archaeon]|nr:GTP-binding protein [archaeon]